GVADDGDAVAVLEFEFGGAWLLGGGGGRGGVGAPQGGEGEAGGQRQRQRGQAAEGTRGDRHGGRPRGLAVGGRRPAGSVPWWGAWRPWGYKVIMGGSGG